jgi:hypothetical protein
MGRRAGEGGARVALNITIASILRYDLELRSRIPAYLLAAETRKLPGEWPGGRGRLGDTELRYPKLSET